MRSEGINPWLYKRNFRKGNNKGLKNLSEGISAGKAGKIRRSNLDRKNTALYVRLCYVFLNGAVKKESCRIISIKFNNTHESNFI